MHQEDHIQIFIFGNAIFKNINKKDREIIENSEQIKLVLQSNQWFIYGEKHQKLNWTQIFSHISSCLAQILILGYINRKKIISQIQYVEYDKLKILNISGNKVSNIQPLTTIHFHCLQSLDMYQNQISQIKCLNRLSTPFLNCLNLTSNPLIEINSFIRSRINQKKFILLLLKNWFQLDPINQNLSIFVKLSSESVQKIQVFSNKRIIQAKVQTMLKLRFPSIQIKRI